MRMRKCGWNKRERKYADDEIFIRGIDLDFSYSFVNNAGHIIELRPREVQYFYSFKHKTNPNIFRPTK